MGFVDIHSHILYGMDDGAKTPDESLQMLQLAAAAGTTDIVATPHADGRYRFDPELIEQRITELSPHVDVRIHRGCDFHLQPDNIDDALSDVRKYTINGNGYLLVEFPELAIFSSTDEILSDLLDAGMVPIITHPERNVQLQRRLDDIARWVELGCYVQITAGSCTGSLGRQARTCIDELMDRGLVHFVGSDAHDTKHRTPSLREAYSSLGKVWGEARVEPLFVQNPRAVLTGDPLERDILPQLKRRRWYRFW